MMVRKKELRDCEVWVNINVRAWQQNLKGIASDGFLNYLTKNKEERILKAQENFVQDEYNYVLEDNKKVIGILKVKESTRDNFKNYGEVQMLYIDPGYIGKGYGRYLLNRGFEILKHMGYNKVIIGCIDNNPSNDFYKHMGGNFICQEPLNILDEKYVENIYEYIL